jgi:hypothetical protein
MADACLSVHQEKIRMTDSAEEPRSPIAMSEVYQVLTSLVMHSEQVRWGRLNTFLVLSSVLIAAWVGVLAGTKPFPDKTLLLFVLCVPGVVLGALWTRLGWRSSEFMDDFHDKAVEIERTFPPGIPMPFHLSENRRETVRRGPESFTTSKWLVSAIPFAFSLFFLALAWFSYRFSP